MGPDSVLLPQRVEFADYPNKVYRLAMTSIDPVERQRLAAPGPLPLGCPGGVLLGAAA